MVKITDAFETEGFVEQRKELERLMMSNPEMEKKVQGLIRKVLSAVRSNMSKEAQDAMKPDPRKASKAVRMMIYKRILGGNVNILNKKRASAGSGKYTPTRTLRSGQRGGNRRDRSERTQKLESYYGSDRGFVLRFLNAGTKDRSIKNFLTNEKRKETKWNKHPNTGFRGHIAPLNFFGNRSHQEMENAADQLTKLIDELIEQELKK